MAMVNPIQLTAVANPNVKDSRWLTLEVCREFQRSKCTRTENECKFAHPPPHVEVQNGRVIACFDSIKGKCQRKEPPCKYLHPPQHLREQLLQNGRNNLILKNLQMQAMQSHIIPTMPMSGGMFQVAPPYLSSAAPTSAAVAASYPFLNASMQTVAAMPGSGSEQSVVPQQVHVPAQLQSSQQKVQRADRLEPPMVEVYTGKKRPRDPTEDLVLSVPGVAVPAYKRMAVGDSKSGLPMYQPQPYPQAATLMQVPYIPVSYGGELVNTSLGAVQTPVSMPVSTRMTYNQLVYAPAEATAMVADPAACTIPSNAVNVEYFDGNKQLLDTLPVCPDFRAGQCSRPQCSLVHLKDNHVEVTDGKVTVCRDSVRGKCHRSPCKYYHIPVPLPPSE